MSQSDGISGSGKEIHCGRGKSLAACSGCLGHGVRYLGVSTVLTMAVEYEGEILYDGSKYDFTIDGYSGTIREWEVERYGR